jgi:ZIP family zinc transporter
MNVLMSDRVSYDRLRNSAVDADHEQDLETPSSSNLHSIQRLVDDHPASASGQGGSHSTWHRAFRIVVSISLHNIPEGMVVGVAFAAASAGATTLGAAATLAVGIGLQNVPEGAAVSLPLRRLGYSRWWSFFFGQLSGALEVLGGVMGAAVVSAASTILPFALSFAAAIMLVVVVRELLPDAVNEENKVTGVHSFVAGFLLMMVLDVALS